jgi:hypothetical protein
MIPKLPLNWFGYAGGAIADAAIKGAYHSDRDCVLVLPPTSDQSFASGPSLVFSVSKREQLPAVALEEGAGGAPDRLRTTQHHFLAALLADKDNLPRRIDHDYPLQVLLFCRGRHALTPARLSQGEPASTTRDLCFTQYCLNPWLRFRLARCLSIAQRGQSPAQAKGLADPVGRVENRRASWRRSRSAGRGTLARPVLHFYW